EAIKLSELSFSIQAFPYGEDPASWPNFFQQAIQAAQVTGQQIGIEPRNLRVLEMDLLQQSAPQTRFIPAEAVIAGLRMYKNEAEVAAMRQAARIAQQALQATLPLIRPGVSERSIAAELTAQLLRHGSEPNLPFFPIIASGPNSANPHAFPTERTLQAGDLIVIDWGATVHGYFSDITRTFALEPVPDKSREIAGIVLAANQAGRQVARPGIQAREVDQAARNVIEQAGFGEYFIHRTGHGLGMETHEEPYIRADNELLLKTGMTFTIEPGIYLPDQAGVRIEDDVIITEDGLESLTDLPRQLISLGR
ncbi:MAG: aminopeptidase P family protein, partial [Anaerolineales bacterium]|nr:aminopeptidase P family protein [Anaerolineales bacterium]